MDGFVTACFEETTTANAGVVRRGEIYVDQPLYLPARHGLRLTNVDPDGYSADFDIVGGRPETLYRHPPLKHPVSVPEGKALIVRRRSGDGR